MADTTFVSKSTPAIPTAWLQDLNDLFYKGTKALTVTNLTTPQVQQSVQNAELRILGGTTFGTDPVISMFGSSHGLFAGRVGYFASIHTFGTIAGGAGVILTNSGSINVATLTASTSTTTPIVDSGSGSLVLKGAGTTAATITGANVVWAGTIQGASTVGVGAATPAATGAGITFPATQSASSDANTLDDYEEGSWSPGVGGTATYNSQIGRYTKVGNKVTIWGFMDIATIGTGSTINITNLPFTSANIGTAQAGVVASNTGGLATAVVSISPRVANNSTNLTFSSRTAANAADSNSALFANAAFIGFGGSYMI